ncbi:acyl-CoA dehydrogenase family protein [Streptomyces hirsutus]|uniref:acyl-CoA dehydrogenase family protein n=1 Tax=Streptomyces hirsutus TaxID=35620 RepID=UPI0033B38F51
MTTPTGATVRAHHRTSLVGRAREIAPVVAKYAADNDAHRVVADEAVQAMVDCGLTRALQPARYGGEEAHPVEFVEAVIEVAKSCTSTGWVLMLLGVHNWEVSHMTEQLQDELFGDDPTTLLSSSYAPHGTATPVEGGYILNGSWKSSSGVTHASWVILGASVEVDGKPLMHNFVVPLAEGRIIDDWFVLGMRGTGSRSVEFDQVFVPAHRALDRQILLAQAGPGLKKNDGPLYRVPQGYLYNLVAGAPALGAGWAFYEEYVDQLKKFTRRFDNAKLSEDRVELLRTNDVRVRLDDQQKVALRILDEGYRLAELGQVPGDLEAARGIYDAARTAEAALYVAQQLMPTMSARVVHELNPLSRLYRDLIVARQHFTQNTDFAAATAANLEMGNPAAATFLLSEAERTAAVDRSKRLYG